MFARIEGKFFALDASCKRHDRIFMVLPASLAGHRAPRDDLLFFALSGEVRFVFTPVLKRSPTTTSGSAPAAQWGQRRRREALAFWTEDRPHSSTTPHTSSRKKASDVL